jgi:adenosylcobinamide amidohydrolase
MTAAGDTFDTVADTAGHVQTPTAGRRARLGHAIASLVADAVCVG